MAVTYVCFFIDAKLFNTVLSWRDINVFIMKQSFFFFSNWHPIIIHQRYWLIIKAHPFTVNQTQQLQAVACILVSFCSLLNEIKTVN